MSEIVKKEEFALIPENDLDFLIWFDEQEKRAKVIRDRLKQAGDEFLTENNTDSYTQKKGNATAHIYRTKAYKKKQVDMKKLKEEGLYDLYTHDVWVKGSIRIQIEYDD